MEWNLLLGVLVGALVFFAGIIVGNVLAETARPAVPPPPRSPRSRSADDPAADPLALLKAFVASSGPCRCDQCEAKRKEAEKN